MNDDVVEALDEQGLHCGRMLSASKSHYAENHRENEVYFNACGFNAAGVQVWWGDIDLTLEGDKVQAAADAAVTTIYITPEQPFRWNGLDGKQDMGWGKPTGLDKRDKERIRRFDPRG